ncbi:MAG: anti-sigma factor family protein [Silvania sp.]
MNTLRFTPPYDDEAIVAWLDGQMTEADARQFSRLLRSEEILAGRTADLMKSNQDYQQAFAPLLDEAPDARMLARLDAHLAGAVAVRPGVSRRALIAASVAFLLTGVGIGYLARPGVDDGIEALHEDASIRDLEAHYMSLYSGETLLDVDSSPSVLRRGLARLAGDMGLQLQESQLVLAGSELKMVRILRYERTPIAQIAWNHADYGPMVLCVSAHKQGGGSAISSEQRYGMNIVWWRSPQYQYALIARTPVAQLQATARQLQAALS